MRSLGMGIGIGMPFGAVGGAAGPGSGDLSLSGIVYSGFTDFSEFGIGAGLPANWTEWGQDDAGNPDTFAIADGGAGIGNYFSLDGHTNGSHFRATYDNWNAANMRYGEVLCRLRMTQGTNGRVDLGPCWGVSGTPATVATTVTSAGVVVQKLTALWRALVVRGSAGFHTTWGNNPFPANQSNVWFWLRVQVIPGTNPATQADHRTRVWAGDYSAEPATWNGEGFDQAHVPNPALTGAIGLILSSFSDASSECRCSYLAFTTDPDVVPTPAPA